MDVLLIDDDEIDRFLASRFLTKSFSINIVKKKDGREALDYLLSIKDGDRYPGLIFLDIIMPIMDGYEFIEQIDIFPRLDLKKKIILLSSSNMRREHEYFLDKETVKGFIMKPICDETILEHKDDLFDVLPRKIQ